MNVSVISTVLNEEGNVRRLIDSLISQSKEPDEIVIVDGFSTDSTYDILLEYCENYEFIKCFQFRGNIAAGRNEAVRRSSNEIIAQIDGGCIAHKEWLSRITTPFSDESVGLVAGFYDMTGDKPIQLAVAPYHGTTPRRFDPRNFLPSGRSIAFRKSIWQKVQGYSEELQWAGEDTLFNYKVIESGVKIVRVPEAYVYWEVPDSLQLILKKFYKYAIGDAQTKIWWHPAKNLSTHNIKIISIYVRYFLAFIFLFLATYNTLFLYIFLLYLIIYAFWSIWKHVEDVKDTQARLLIPLIQFTSDFAVMAGFFVGTVKQLRKR